VLAVRPFVTEDDDLNALASTILEAGSREASVYRLRPPPGSRGVVAPFTGADILFGPGLTRPALIRRYADGARILAHPVSGKLADGHDLLFLIRQEGKLKPVTEGGQPRPRAGDNAVVLGPAG
jgi:hypothetical protein